MKVWWKKFEKLYGLSAKEILTLIKTFFLLLWIKLGLSIFSFKTFKKLYTSIAQTNNKQTEIQSKIKSINMIANNLPLGFTCLPQALALKYYLQKDKEAKLIIGVNKEKQSLIAHAWVEKNSSRLIGDLPLQNYFPIWEWE